jgi:hypothetical protein
MTGLEMYGSIGGLKGILAEIHCIITSGNTVPKRYGSDHECPVGEGNEEAVSIHVQEIGHVTHQRSQKHYIS